MFADKHPVAFYILVFVTLIFGLVLAVWPFSPFWINFRPEIICLLAIYWVMNNPLHLGIVFGFCSGLVQDVVEASVWGAHALALSLVAYICIASYQRIKNYSIWHQSIWVFVLVGVHQVIVGWIQGLAGYHSDVSQILLPTAVSAFCWPILFLALQRFRLAYRMT